MKIALVAPIEETIPPHKYGGTEWIVYYIAHEMGKRGHQVDLYAAGDSKKESEYNLIPIIDKSIRTTKEGSSLKMREALKFITWSDLVDKLNKENYDIIHNNVGWRFLLFSPFIKSPIVSTHHSSFAYEDQNAVFRHFKNNFFVSISDNQRTGVEDLPFVATVYNGINESLFPFTPFEQGKHHYMAFLARMNHEKGAVEAAQTAQATHKQLRIGCKIDIVDKPYYKQFQKIVNPNYVTLLGEVGPEERLNLLSGARCLLAPINWEEPFGLMFIEALACGTPVISFARGSACEIVVDGVTGFLINSSLQFKRGDFLIKNMGLDGLKEAVEKIYALSDAEYAQMRQKCRAHFEANFTAKKMADGYENVYKNLIK